MARAGNDYWQFNKGGKARCPICEGTGQLQRGTLCMYCDGSGKGQFRYDWWLILDMAARIVVSYMQEGSDEATVTLRQLFYQLVSMEALPNTQQAYSALSAKSAEARRGESKQYRGIFPKLMDRGRDIDRPHLWTDAIDAFAWLSRLYMEDRSATQDYSIYVVVEKNALRGQLFQWFAPLGLPIVALGGYPSQTIVDRVREEIDADGRQSVLVYGGDFDADGEDIMRDFEVRVDRFEIVERVALLPAQIEQFNLPPQPGKWTSARAKGFAEKYRRLFQRVYGYDLVQIELDALSPEDLQRIYKEAIDEYFDYDLYNDIVEHEAAEKKKVLEVAGIGEDEGS